VTTLIPAGLCAVHHQKAVDWRNNTYDARNPGEWPCGLSVPTRTLLMDSRTSHEERVKEFEQKNREQVELVARICLSGRSPECSPSPSQGGGTDG
jgi:hypothetical protein